MSNTIADVLKQLDELNLENSIQVFVPSLQRILKFKPLNLKQQKELLRTTIDESLVKLAFNNLLSNIISDNSVEKININSLYTFDRAAIALSLRAKGLDKDLKIDDKTINLEQKATDIVSIPVDLNKFKQTIKDSNVSIGLTIPKLGVDKEINAFALNKIKSSPENDLKAVISDLVIYEFVKFIEYVEIQVGENKEVLNFDTLKPSERITVIEKFPSTITNKIFDYVKSYREFESQFTHVDGTNIDIDGNFFTI